MRRPSGFTFETNLNGLMLEGETYMCAHCNRHTAVKPYQRPEDMGGLCKRCMGLTCPHCAAQGDCDPLEAKLERWERVG